MPPESSVVSASLEEAIHLIIALLMVAAYSWFRYSTPATVRLETTFAKFLLGRVAYVAIIVIGFITLVRVPGVLEGLLAVVDVPDSVIERLEVLMRPSSVPLVLALVFTVLLSEIPILTRVDRTLRGYFHRVAAIPRERRRWIDLLRNSALLTVDETGELPEELHEKLAALFEEQELGAEAIVLSNGASNRHRWTRLSVMMLRLEELETARPYSQFLESSVDYDSLRQKYDLLAVKTPPCLKLARENPDDEAVKMLQHELAEQLRALEDDIYELVSKLLMEQGRTEAMRRDCVQRVGLKPDERPIGTPIGPDEILWILLLSTLFLGLTAKSLGFHMIVMISGTYVLTVLIALTVARIRSRIFPPERSVKRVPPVGYYLVAGALGMAGSACFSIAFRTLTGSATGGPWWEYFVHGHVQSAQTYFTYYWPWSLISFVLAALLAALTDGWLDARIQRVRERYTFKGWANPLDGLVVAASLALLVGLVVHPLVARMEGYPNPHLASRLVVTLRVSGMGLLLGTLVPVAFRCRTQGKTQPQDQNSPDAAAAMDPQTAGSGS